MSLFCFLLDPHILSVQPNCLSSHPAFCSWECTSTALDNLSLLCIRLCYLFLHFSMYKSLSQGLPHCLSCGSVHLPLSDEADRKQSKRGWMGKARVSLTMKSHPEQTRCRRVNREGMGEEWKDGKGVKETERDHSSRMEFLTYAAGMSGMQNSLIWLERERVERTGKSGKTKNKKWYGKEWHGRRAGCYNTDCLCERKTTESLFVEGVSHNGTNN